MIFYTNWFVWRGMAATTWGPFIFIRPRSRADVGLLEHEKVHVAQFKRNPFFGLAYLFSKKARLRYEVAAYRRQMEFNPERVLTFAGLLATKYRLGITKEEALEALLGDS